MMFIYKITEVKFCMSLRKYPGEKIAAKDTATYMNTTPS